MFRLYVERVTREKCTLSVDAETLAEAKDVAEALGRNHDLDFGAEIVTIEIREAP